MSDTIRVRSSIKPHELYLVWSPDEVAECMEGIFSSGLYATLWQLVEKVPPDTSEVPDSFSERCLARVWDYLTEEEQRKLNELAAAHDKLLRDAGAQI